ncbi:MAG: hypothetical protein ABIS30_06915 [Gallionella sp.]
MSASMRRAAFVMAMHSLRMVALGVPVSQATSIPKLLSCRLSQVGAGLKAGIKQHKNYPVPQQMGCETALIFMQI